MRTINYKTEIWKEGSAFVSWCPELDVSSVGSTVTEARKNLREAVELFIEEAGKMGTLDEILEESGYNRSAGGWSAPEIVASERDSLALA